jgi:hypothetical protein
VFDCNASPEVFTRPRLRGRDVSQGGYRRRMTDRVYDLELSPTARQAGVAYLHDVDLDASEELAVGDRVMVRDEGGAMWDAEVTVVEEVRLGRKYRLRMGPADLA